MATDASAFRYMPFSRGRCQKISTPVKADGAVVMVEFPAAGLIWGARTWAHISPMPDAQRLFQLFNNVLDYAASLHLHVGLETIVSETDWKDIHQQKLAPTLEPKAYRLWIAMGSGEHALFLSAVTSALTQLVVNEEDEEVRRPAKKRRNVKQELKCFLRPVEDKTEMIQLLRLYWHGRLSEERGIDTSCAVSDDAGWGGDIDEMSEGHTSTRNGLLSEYLAASAFFESPLVQRRWEQHDILSIQRDLTSYVNGNQFYPVDELINTGLFRYFQVGPGHMLPEGAKSLQMYCLPFLEPSTKQIHSKFSQLAASVGQSPGNVDAMSIDDLVSFEDSVGDQSIDPFLFSPVELDKSDIEGGAAAREAVSHGTSVQNQIYYVISALRQRTIHHITINLEKNNIDAFYKTLGSTVHNLFGMLSLGVKIEGVPKAYSVSFVEGQQLFETITGSELTREALLAKKMFMSIPKTRSPHTFCSKMLSKALFGSATAMSLMGPQRVVYLIVWLTMFRIMKNDMAEPASCYICAGPPETGKSTSLNVSAECCARSLVRVTGGQSSLAITVTGDEDDMALYIQDEMDTDTDGRGRSTKLAQTALSDKVIEYRVKSQKADGTWFLDKQTAIRRIVFATSTNFLGDVPDAMLSRACTIELIANKGSGMGGSSAADEKRARTNLGVATATDPLARRQRNAFVLASRLLMAQTSRFWSLHAIGAVPTISTIVFTAFCSILHTNFKAFELSPRRIADLRTLSEAIMVFDVCSLWYTCVGKEYNYDPVVEALFYNSRAFVRAEHCVSAWSIMEQSTTLNVQLQEVGSVLKTQIKVDKETHQPIVHETADGAYFELIQNKKEQIFATLRSVFPNFGPGLIRRLMKVIDEGSCNGSPNIRVLPIDGQDRFLCSAEWINDSITSPRTPAETAIIKICHRFCNDNSLCNPEFDREAEMLVFRSKIRTCIMTGGNSGPTTSLTMPELDGLSDSAIALAMQFMKRIKHPETGESVFDACDMARSCKYVDQEAKPDGTLSEVVPHKVKLPQREIAPLLISKELIAAVCDTSGGTVTESDKLCMSILSVGGHRKYLNHSVFSGVNQLGTHKLYSQIILKDNFDSTVTVTNPFFVGANTFDNYYPPESSDDCEVTEHNSVVDPGIYVRTKVFPEDQSKITLSKHSELEDKLQAAYMMRIPKQFHSIFNKF